LRLDLIEARTSSGDIRGDPKAGIRRLKEGRNPKGEVRKYWVKRET
jgi:hypothetical protein